MADKYIKQLLKRIFKQIAKWKGFHIRSWRIGDEHILSIPPKYSISYTVAIIKGKSSAWIKKNTKKFPKGTLWNRGYFISTIGFNEYAVKRYIENQQRNQIELKQQKLSFW